MPSASSSNTGGQTEDTGPPCGSRWEGAHRSHAAELFTELEKARTEMDTEMASMAATRAGGAPKVHASGEGMAGSKSDRQKEKVGVAMMLPLVLLQYVVILFVLVLLAFSVLIHVVVGFVHNLRWWSSVVIAPGCLYACSRHPWLLRLWWRVPVKPERTS